MIHIAAPHAQFRMLLFLKLAKRAKFTLFAVTRLLQTI